MADAGNGSGDSGENVAPVSACVVTGYIRIDSEHRDHSEYERLGQRLLEIGLPTVAFLDEECRVAPPASTTVVPASEADFWYPAKPVPAFANPLKDTQAFLSVQHQKTAWLAEAAGHTDADFMVWIDFGILHVRGVTPEAIADFFQRVPRARRDVVTTPSIWGMPSPGQVSFQHPAWFFAGGVLIVPRRLAEPFDQAVRHAASLSPSGTWEVNTWAAVAEVDPSRFDSYPADHDGSLFTGFLPE